MKKYKYRKTINIIQPDGSLKRFDVYADSEIELEQKVAQKQNKAEEIYQRHLKPFFETVADEWNEYHESEIEYNTWVCYQAPLKHAKQEFSGMLLEEIEPLDVQRFLNKMKMQGYKRQSINLRKIVINLVFEFAILNGYIRYNPCVSVRVPKAEKGTTDLPSQEEIEIVKQNIDKPIGLLAYVIMFTGCRRGEALGLKYEDFDFSNNIIKINRSVYHKNNKAEIKEPKTKNGIRTIPLLKPLRNVIPQNKQGYIFTNNGSIYTKSYINKEWRKYNKSFGTNITFLQLRHVFATFCFDADLSEKDTQHIMGHSKIETTRNIYTHIRESRRKVSANKLNDFLENAHY